LLAKIYKYETAERVPGSGRPRTARVADNVATVEQLVQRTVRETADISII